MALKVSILKNKKFAISVALTMLVQAALIVGSVLNPIYIQTIRGYGASVSGLIMLPASIVMLIMSPVSGRFIKNEISTRRLNPEEPMALKLYNNPPNPNVDNITENDWSCNGLCACHRSCSCWFCD